MGWFTSTSSTPDSGSQSGGSASGSQCPTSGQTVRPAAATGNRCPQGHRNTNNTQTSAGTRIGNHDR